MELSVEGKSVSLAQGAKFEDALKEGLSGKRFKTALAARCPGCDPDADRLYGLSAPIPSGCTVVEPVYADSPEGREMIRHSASHIMADAVKRLFPTAQVTIGPAIENGFYYDFDYERPFSQEDFEAIEAEMKKIISENAPFTCELVSKAEAVELFKGIGEHYKVEIIEEIPAEQVSLYRHGQFVDLCRGPHIPSTGFVGAFKLMSVAGAYWRGSEKNRMLSRIYATAFPTEKELAAYLNQIEEAKRRDHRKLGKELDLFAFHEDVAAGMVFWLPRGMLLRTILEDFSRKEHLKRGYELVQGPQIMKVDLWKVSGHYDNYRENMYFTEIENEEYAIKPMNCPAHMLMFNHHIRSYRDMPIRMFELGLVHRHEMSGVLHGLLRVRQFTQDDAHIFCRPDQLEDEIIGVMDFIKDVLHLFDFDFKVQVSTRPEKSIGSDEDWERATASLIGALERIGMPYTINAGDGAFYGPKIDVKLMDALNREWQCSTIQVDFTLPERFDCAYVGEDGERHRPVMVHRAMLGSIERFIGVLTEHYAGAFPLWLAPTQARILTVTDNQAAYAQSVCDKLKALGIRAEADLRNEKLGYKVREAQVAKVPYMLVIGDKEMEEGNVNIRPRKGDSLGAMSVEDFADMVKNECMEPFKRGGMSYTFS